MANVGGNTEANAQEANAQEANAQEANAEMAQITAAGPAGDNDSNWVVKGDELIGYIGVLEICRSLASDACVIDLQKAVTQIVRKNGGSATNCQNFHQHVRRFFETYAHYLTQIQSVLSPNIHSIPVDTYRDLGKAIRLSLPQDPTQPTATQPTAAQPVGAHPVGAQPVGAQPGAQEGDGLKEEMVERIKETLKVSEAEFVSLLEDNPRARALLAERYMLESLQEALNHAHRKLFDAQSGHLRDGEIAGEMSGEGTGGGTGGGTSEEHGDRSGGIGAHGGAIHGEGQGGGAMPNMWKLNAAFEADLIAKLNEVRDLYCQLPYS